MPAIVTDQFRILNANNFVESVENTNNSYYVFVGLANPKGAEKTSRVGFGRTSEWNEDDKTPAPVDSFSYRAHVGDTMSFGKKVSSANIRRIIRRVDWVQGQRYEIYRDDYSASNQSPLTKSNRLYDANYYVLNSDFKVYVCIDNGSSGTNPLGNVSQDEPTFTDLEPSKAGNSGDGFIWKYLFTISPSDIVKFDSTEFITVPNNWATSTDSQIRAVRENGDSSVNNNQIKHIYIDNAGANYTNKTDFEVDILGDGTGGKARIDVVDGKITRAIVSSGGKGYSYGIVDLDNLSNTVSSTERAKLIPIIPPKLGHGFDVYTELGTDKVIIYARFDDSTNDFPIDTQFSQVGVVKNPTKIGTSNIYTEQTFSSLQAIKFDDTTVTGTPDIGEEIVQTLSISPNVGQIANGYIASFDKDTKVLKYFRDRSLNFGNTKDHTDALGISTVGRIYEFESSSQLISQKVAGSSAFSGTVDTSFNDSSVTPTGGKLVNLGVQFTAGLSQPEINKGSGEIVYLDNRPIIVRNSRQKEDIKIILEF